MAPASASPQPPAERSGTPRSDTPQTQEHCQPQQTEEQHEAYGPLDVDRRVKDDGRGLILYARHKHEGR